MEFVYYTIAAIVLYTVSDYILNLIEIKMGKRLASRSFIFLIIISTLALASFSVIRAIFAPLPQTQSTMQDATKVPAPELIKESTER